LKQLEDDAEKNDLAIVKTKKEKTLCSATQKHHANFLFSSPSLLFLADFSESVWATVRLSPLPPGGNGTDSLE